jgi:hypothetical protein
MLPVSGAEQFSVSEASGFLPSSIVEIRQALARLGVGQEEVPEPGLLGLLLGAVQQLELARRIGPAVRAALAQPEVLVGDRVDVVADVLDDRLVKGLGLLGHAQVVECAVDGFLHVFLPCVSPQS